MPSGAEVVKVDYSNQDSLVQALRGQDVLLITMSVMAPPDQQMKLVEAAAEAGVPWVFPNEWGGDFTKDPKLGQDVMLGPGQMKVRDRVEELGKSSWLSICCGFWYEWSLAGGPARYGFDVDNKSAILFDEGDTRITTTTWPQVGRAVAKLLSLKVLPEDESDKSPHLSQFGNRAAVVSSFLLSQREMLASILRVTGDSEKDWKISFEPSKKRYAQGVSELQSGDPRGFSKLLYTRVFYPDGSGNYETHGLQNDLLGLPKENLDETTKFTLEQASKGVYSI